MSGDFTEAAGALSRFAWALQHHAGVAGVGRWHAPDLQLQWQPGAQGCPGQPAPWRGAGLPGPPAAGHGFAQPGQPQSLWHAAPELHLQ